MFFFILFYFFFYIYLKIENIQHHRNITAQWIHLKGHQLGFHVKSQKIESLLTA